MKKTILGVILLALTVFLFFLIPSSEPSIKILKEKHAAYLSNSPFKEVLKLTKKERKSRGIPPNKYYEREWELTMNPASGRPEPQKVIELQDTFLEKGIKRRTPGDAINNKWVERGPNNVGGRTRVLLFDPNDESNKRVFAGGVSGGLWVNDDITNSSSVWNRITNVPSNMAVSCITVDPNNSNIMYVGTGELYTIGAVTGNGVYKSADGGASWSHVFGGNSGATFGTNQKIVPGEYFIQDVIAWDNNGSTEVFIAVGASFLRLGGNIATFLGAESNYGVYKSVDNGVNWTKPSVPEFNGNTQQPNDFEIGADNKIWLSTTGNYFGDNGGAILSSTDGNTFVQVRKLSNLKRTEIEASATDPNKLYVLARTTANLPIIYKTTDGFSSNPTVASLPSDSDSGIKAEDFTRGQAFYNLLMKIDPVDDDIIYVGGIDLFRSTDGATTWKQISKWHGGISGSYSVVHADQHAMTFRPGNTNQAVFGNDGGVYYASTLSGANTNASAISSVNTGYNVTQFYRTAIGPTSGQEYFLGGTQDNGTPFFNAPNSTGPDGSIDISGGDGAYCFVDQVGEKYLIVSYVNNDYTLIELETGNRKTIVEENSDGDFINQADLDYNLDILYANGSNGESSKIYRYSNLLSISNSGSATSTTLSNGALTSSPTAIKVSPHTVISTTLLVGTENGELLKVINANSNPSWANISGPNFLGSISDVEFGKSENEIFVTFHNYGVDNIWYSANGGISWSSKEGNFPDIPVKCILQNPLLEEEVIIGTELGVWKTENWDATNPTWVQTYNGMSDVKVTDLQHRNDGNAVLAATFGRGLFTGIFYSDKPTFSLSTSTPSVEARLKTNGDPEPVIYTVNYAVLNEFDDAVSFAVTGAPAGTDITFSPASPITINTSGLFTFTVANSAAYVPGALELTVTGTSRTETKSIKLILDVIDSDEDGIPDVNDNCPTQSNPEQRDFDEDGKGDLCDDSIDISEVVPKGFSPNGDGINDTWQIEKINSIYEQSKVQIYNRSGVLVYEASPYLNDFDGYANKRGNQKLPIGSYIYVVNTGDPVAPFYPKAHVKKGWLYINY